MTEKQCFHPVHRLSRCAVRASRAPAFGPTFGLDLALTCGLGCGLLVALAGCGSPTPAPATPAPSSSTAAAATVPSRPTLGYLWDAHRAGLRPLLGVPGAANLGADAYAEGTYTAAVPCARQNYALSTNAGGAVFLLSLPAGPVLQISEKLSPRQRIALSPSCSAALIYAPDSATGILISGLPSAPAALSVSLASSMLGAAVSDSASILFATSASNRTIVVEALAAGSNSATSAARLAGYGGMAFLPGGDSALLADSGLNTVSLISQVSSTANSTQLASAADGLSHPMAVAGSADGRSAMVVNTGGSSLMRIDLSGLAGSPGPAPAAPAKLLCQCTSTELVALSGNAVFQLNEPASGTVYAYDGDSPSPRIVFLPADIVSSGAAANVTAANVTAANVKGATR